MELPKISNSKAEIKWQFAKEAHILRTHLETLEERFPAEFKGANVKKKQFENVLFFLSELEKAALENYQNHIQGDPKD